MSVLFVGTPPARSGADPSALSATPVLRRACACGGTPGPTGECEACRQKRLQRSASAPGPAVAPPVVHDVLASPGRPLDSAVRVEMEPRFGHSFADVRVHADGRADASARAVAADAYTVGRSVVFAAGRYAPGSAEGRRLIAHELAHVVQQRGAAPALQPRLEIGAADDPAEGQANAAADAVAAGRADGASALAGGGACAAAGPRLRREPTQPRAATGAASLADIKAQTGTLAPGKTTAGSLARQEWESLFRRHFTEPDKVVDEVESSHARYLYSSVYGWIDAQHFFAHIQFAEESGLQGATDRGIEIEGKQSTLRGLVGPDPDDNTAYSVFLESDLMTPEDFLHYREDLFIAISLGVGHVLGPQEKALIKGFDDVKMAKFILDNAMSAWSYEDLVSNQLGVQFFRLHGAYVNAGADPAEVRRRFIERMGEFFGFIQVVDDPAKVKSLGAKLPGKERWTSPKMDEAQARKKFPELFEFGGGTHRLRVVIHDTEEGAQKGMAHIAGVAPSVPGLHVAPLGSQFAVYTGPVSRFEAVVMRMLLSKAIPISPKAVVVEPVAKAAAPAPAKK